MIAPATKSKSAPVHFRDRRRISRLARVGLLLALGFGWCAPAVAADLKEAEKLYRTGRYDECARLVDDEMGLAGWSEPWRHLRIKAELATGKYDEAKASLEG